MVGLRTQLGQFGAVGGGSRGDLVVDGSAQCMALGLMASPPLLGLRADPLGVRLSFGEQVYGLRAGVGDDAFSVGAGLCDDLVSALLGTARDLAGLRDGLGEDALGVLAGLLEAVPGECDLACDRVAFLSEGNRLLADAVRIVLCFASEPARELLSLQQHLGGSARIRRPRGRIGALPGVHGDHLRTLRAALHRPWSGRSGNPRMKPAPHAMCITANTAGRWARALGVASIVTVAAARKDR